MKRRVLGRTGLEVSELALGTVALGTAYGIAPRGECDPPGEREAIGVIRAALAGGIDLFDTAPSYGGAEALLGTALADSTRCTVCTKVGIPQDAEGRRMCGTELEAFVTSSVESSLERLRRPRIDVLQLHNATLDALRDRELTGALNAVVKRGLVDHLGVSVYREDEALAALECDSFGVLQIGLSLLDQRPSERILPLAERRGVGVITRSALLRGALTPRARLLPPDLARVSGAADAARRMLALSWEQLPDAALRFCLSVRGVSTTLIGVSSLEELDSALSSAERGPLTEQELARTTEVAVTDPAIVNPSLWPVP